MEIENSRQSQDKTYKSVETQPWRRRHEQ